MSESIKDLPPVIEEPEVPELTSEQRVKLWNAVIGAIEKEGGAYYDQRTYTEDHGVDCEIRVFKGSCGTIACIAGHAIHEAVQLKILPPFQSYCDNVHGTARRLLGLTSSAADSLFDAEFLDGVSEGVEKEVAKVLREVRDLQVQGADTRKICDVIDGYQDDSYEPDSELEDEVQ